MELAEASFILPKSPDIAENHSVPPTQNTLRNSCRGTVVYLQDLCCRHRYIRSRDTSAIFERPERLRAVKVGLAAALARLEELVPTKPAASGRASDPDSDVLDEGDLTAALLRMNLASDRLEFPELRTIVVQSSASVDILKHPAVKFVHGDIDGDVYLQNLTTWARNSRDNIAAGGSEIPEGLSQGDLYLCPDSIDAIQGALGSVCEAVDAVVRSTGYSQNHIPESTMDSNITANRAFVAIRPPGHHCGEDTPSGFCFVNNVAVGAAYAHIQHGINRVVILDIDLHHGNGTQSISWQINEEAYRLTLDLEPNTARGPSLQIYYGSVHDVLSYPCEDGNIDLVQAASVSLQGPHGQYIENIHLKPYSSEDHFWEVLYKDQYSKLLKKAEQFVEETGSGEHVLVFISCGFDACEHEYPAMSRHNRKVPTSFYHRFAKDAAAFADRYARGRIISVLEGGYSDRALTSGAMAHLSGLVDTVDFGAEVNENWWSIENLVNLEQATKKRRGGRSSLSSTEPWLERTTAIFSGMDAGSSQKITPSSSRNLIPTPPSSMTLRDRKKPTSKEPSPLPSPSVKAKIPPEEGRHIPTFDDGQHSQKHNSSFVLSGNTLERSGSSPDAKEDPPSKSPTIAPKKLPRVILRLGPAPESLS